MNPDRWSRIKEILDRVVDEPAGRQRELVHAACVTEPELEAEILQLVQAYSASSDFLEAGVGELYDGLAPKQPEGPALEAGALLARRFEVRGFINRGGMGEVYEAWDAQLNQAVALKTILPYISANPAVIERFKREVRHAREVSHPNICRVHELFCDESATEAPIWFLSMELLRGVTLLEHIRTEGRLSPKLAAHLADQMLAGLEAAHLRGLVHRDFKSGNVMLLQVPDGPPRAVITDFGLAVTNLPDGTSASDLVATGTPGYMPPEQKRGESVGPAADQYALGVVLWEMMTGLAPPALGAPRVGMRHGSYPVVWSKVIRRCTAAEANDRFRDMAAVRAALLPSPARKRLLWAAALALLLVGLFASLWMHRPGPATEACVICNTAQITPDVDKSESPSLSRDGHLVAYSSDRAEPGNLDIFVQALPAGPLVRLTRDAARDTAPSISPDGSLVAFRSEREGGGIYLAAMRAPREARLLVADGRDPKFSPDGKSLLYWTGDPDSSMPSGKVFRLALRGGAPEPVAPALTDARYPIWNANGQQVLLTGCAEPGDLLPTCFDWWVGSPAGAALTPTHAFAALRAQEFLPGRLSSLEWRDDQVVFSAMGPSGRLNLAAITVPAASPQALGRPQWLMQADAGAVNPSLSADHHIAFTQTTGAMHIWQVHGLDGRKRPVLEKVTADREVDGTPFIADGGRYLVFARGRSLKRVIVQREMATGLESVLVNQGTPVQSPIIDRSGSWLAYQQTEPDGSSAIYAGHVGGPMRRVCGNCTEPFGWFGAGHSFLLHDGSSSVALADAESGDKRRIVSEPGAVLSDSSWSAAKGEMVAVQTRQAARELVLFHLDQATAQPDRPPVLITEERGIPMRPRWFGEGRGIVYVSNRDGFMCLYVRRFDAKKRAFAEPGALMHLHHQLASIDEVLPRVLNVSADGDMLFVNLGERNSTIQVGQLAERH